jgi:hypothetical protein
MPYTATPVLPQPFPENPFRKELALNRKKISENSENHSFLATRCHSVAIAIFL